MTNYERLDAMSDDMIDLSNIPPLTEDFFATAKWRMPKDQTEMQAYRTETVVSQDGELHLLQLPFQPGELIEVIVLSRHPQRVAADPFPLKETVVKYEAPTEPVASDDWAVFK